jgi:SM-20-related protein
MQINLAILEQMIQDLSEQQYATSDQLFPRSFVEKLAQECENRFVDGQLKKSAIGIGADRSIQQEIRGDFTSWIDLNSATSEQKQLLGFLETLQMELNRELYLGLRRFEIHFAYYPPKAGYDKHIDNPKGQGNRRITFILYLNENWQPADGGVLAVFDPQQPHKIIAEITPTFGKVVLFCSDIFPHEVQKANAPRKSITGWFRNDAL